MIKEKKVPVITGERSFWASVCKLQWICVNNTRELKFLSHDEEKGCTTAHPGLNEQWRD